MLENSGDVAVDVTGFGIGVSSSPTPSALSRWAGIRAEVARAVAGVAGAWVERNKGAAVLWLLGRMGLDRPDVVPFYLGDDTTDEDAFRVIRGRDIGIVVGPAGRPTAARYSLADPDEVRIFLERLTGR